MLAACGIFGPVQFTIAWVVVGSLVPGYSPRRDYISELSASGAPYAGPMIAAFLLLGVLSLAFAVGLRRGFGEGSRLALDPWLVGIFGAGAIGSGLFRCDPGCGGTSLSNALHSLITHMGLGALVLATLVLPLRFQGDGRWRGYRAYSWLTGVAAIIVFARGLSSFGGVGLGERLFVSLLFLWLVVIGQRLYRLSAQ